MLRVMSWSDAVSVCTSQDSSSIRSMAVQQLGELVRDMSQHKSMLRHVVLRGLVPLILFLEDTETRVVRVSPGILFSSVCLESVFLYRQITNRH